MSMPNDTRPQIINVTRKPSKCPVCGSEVVDIVYGTGDMTEMDFMLEYRKDIISRHEKTLAAKRYGWRQYTSPSTYLVLFVWMQTIQKSKRRRNGCSCKGENVEKHPQGTGV